MMTDEAELVSRPSPSPPALPEGPTLPESDKPLDREGVNNFLAVLQNPNFLALWGGQVLSQMADKVFLVLMITLISSRFQEAGESISGWVSAIMVTSTLPAVLFGAVAGVYVDRWPKQLILVGSNLLRGSLVLSLPPLLWTTRNSPELHGIPLNFGVLLAITLGVSTLTQFFAPAEQSALPLVVPKQDLLSANSLCTATMMGALIMGFAIGEPLLAWADRGVHYLLPGATFGPELMVGGSYLLSSLALSLMRPQTEDHLTLASQPHIWDDLKIGLQYLKDTQRVRAALIQQIALYSVFAALAVLAVRLAELMPVLKASQFGFLLAGAGVGMGFGAFTVGHTGSQISRVRWSLMGSLGMALCLASMGWVTHLLWTTLAFIGGIGFCGALVGVPMQTLIQEETPEDRRGKVFGLQNNLINISLSLPLVLASVAETRLGLTPVFVGLAVLMAVSGLLTWRTAQPPAQS